ncbi:MAG TPA: RimK/LysX family protein [Candidatus Saccharimonadales bacterium]|nr:RimK/LysX family protein [Candidatus Saccharimonadales bacterium]
MTKQTPRTRATEVIGAKTLVDFPTLGILGVPAKIDTGADSSSIWASNIREEKGEIYFTLFDVNSPHYTGDELHSSQFQLVSVKNSFGVAEYRYKVLLPVVINNRKLRVRFTLANRGNNSNPILIGRRTIRNKFIVDVSVDSVRSTRRMLLLSSRITPDVTKFIKAIEETAGIQMTHSSYDDLVFEFDKTLKITLQSTGEDIATYDILHCKTSVERDVTAAVARYALKRGVRVLDDIAIQSFPTTSKLYQYAMLIDENIPIPKSLFVTPATLIKSYALFKDTLGLPFVLKGIHGSKGRDNFAIYNEEDFDRSARLLAKNNIYAVGQKFISNEGDYRVLVFGRKITLVIYRTRDIKKGSHLNNTSQGGVATLEELNSLPVNVQIMCLDATKILGRDIAGVDMVHDSETGLWYCFEVNDGPQLATGAFRKEKQQAFAAFIQRELEK